MILAERTIITLLSFSLLFIIFIVGTNVNTEMHSALSAILEDPDDKATALNADLLFELKLYDKVP